MEEDERQDKAARKLQNAYRGRQARLALKKLVRENYVKLYDRINDQYVYKNKNTKEIFLQKPVFLGQDDLPTPKIFAAPNDYDPKDDFESDGYALVVTVTAFSNGRIQELTPAVNTDHLNLEELLTHDFICKFRLENCIFLKNPTCAEFRQAMDDLRRLCKRRGYFVMYLCTHVATVFKGDPQDKKENAYLLMKDTLWTKPPVIAKTAISLRQLCAALNRIACRRKTVFLNYAHQDRPKRSIFKSKSFYPPEDFLPRLSQEANCVVIASCTSGTTALNIIKHTPQRLDLKAPREQTRRIIRPSSNQDFDGAAHDASGSANVTVDDNTSLISAGSTSVKSFDSSSTKGFNQNESSWSIMASFRKPRVVDTPLGPDRPQGADINSNDATAFVDEPVYYSCPLYDEMHERFTKEWKIAHDKPIVVSTRPPMLMATWQKDAETFYEVKVKLPTEKEETKQFRRVQLWRCKRIFGPPLNAARVCWRANKRRNLCSPAQTSLSTKRGTVFGKALVEALRGESSSPEEPYVSVAAIYPIILAKMAHTVASLQAAALEELPPRRVGHQCPVLMVPEGKTRYVTHPVCCRCGPPPAPERPFIVRVGYNEVQLEWYNPEFDGVTPTQYRLSMFNVSRNFSTWRLLDYKGLISTTRFLVRNLPMGIPCQFKVAAYNNGGWGELSDESLLATPGEEQLPLSTALRWKRLSLGGALSIMDRMDSYQRHRHEQVGGLEKLLQFTLKEGGLKKGTMASRASLLCLRAMQNFPDDLEIAPRAFEIIGLCLRGKAQRKLKALLMQHSIVELCDHYVHAFRNNTGVIAGIVLMRSALMSNIAAIPDIIPPEDEEEKKDEDEDDSTDDEGQVEQAAKKDAAKEEAADVSSSAKAAKESTTVGTKKPS